MSKILYEAPYYNHATSNNQYLSSLYAYIFPYSSQPNHVIYQWNCHPYWMFIHLYLLHPKPPHPSYFPLSVDHNHRLTLYVLMTILHDIVNIVLNTHDIKQPYTTTKVTLSHCLKHSLQSLYICISQSWHQNSAIQSLFPIGTSHSLRLSIRYTVSFLSLWYPQSP